MAENQEKTYIRITKVKSSIDRPHDQKGTLKMLKLNKIGQYCILESNPSILGMVRKVEHLVEVTPHIGEAPNRTKKVYAKTHTDSK